jgi:hypothetical protein
MASFMSNTRTTVEILNKSLEKIAEIKALYPINKSGMVLRYSKELSDYGHCEFRIAKEDPVFTTFGDIIEPHKYHVRIKRGNKTVWQGAIVDNPQRNHRFWAVKAAEYDFYLDKILVKRTRKVGYNQTEPSGAVGLHYRVFSSGTMSSAITSILSEAKTALGSNHVLADLTNGTIENPPFPSNFVKADGTKLTGNWTFSSDVVLEFDYHSVLYVLKAFGIYSASDFTIDDSLVFNFKKFIGNKQPGITFEYGSRGNIADYDVPRYGSRMANDIYGIAADPKGIILHANKRDEKSVNDYGLMQNAKAYADVKGKNPLAARLKEEIGFLRTPEESPINLELNEKAYPNGQYDVGDLITVKIKDGPLDFKSPRRIVGITVTVHNTGREITTVQTNRPRDEDLAA